MAARSSGAIPPELAPSWRECLFAASRKIQISGRHLQSLSRRAYQGEWPLSIDTQLVVEGVISSAVAAADQVGLALASAATGVVPSPFWKGQPENIVAWLEEQRDGGHSGAVKAGSVLKLQSVAHLKNWAEQPIYRDARLVRNKMMHAVYGKLPGADGWKVEQPSLPKKSTGTLYLGSRELSEYCDALMKVVDLKPAAVRRDGNLYLVEALCGAESVSPCLSCVVLALWSELSTIESGGAHRTNDSVTLPDYWKVAMKSAEERSSSTA